MVGQFSHGQVCSVKTHRPSMLARLITVILGYSIAATQLEAQVESKSQSARDARALVTKARDILRSNHPGAVSGIDEEFVSRMKEGYSRAIEMSTRVQTRSGILAVLRYFAAQFRDEHLSIIDLSPQEELSFPGFLVRFHDGQIIVGWVYGDIGAKSMPDQGDTLLECDGISADTLVRERRFQFGSNPNLKSHWVREAAYLLIDDGNPFIKRLRRCTFLSGSVKRSILLDWHPFDRLLLAAHIEDMQFGESPVFGTRRVDANTTWVNIPSFNLHDASQRDSAERIKQTLKSVPPQDLLVLDLRGNIGGVGLWALELAIDAMGQNAVLCNKNVRDTIWNFQSQIRASPDNTAQYQIWYKNFKNAASWSQSARNMLRLLRDSATSALASRQLLSTPVRLAPALPETGPCDSILPRHKRIVVLTDGRCASACLFFLDWIKSVPHTRHVGFDTNADTQYTDVRTAKLSADFALNFPMHLMRGRARASNQPHVPVKEFRGWNWSAEQLEAFVLSVH